MNLTEHFTLEELCYSEYATRRGIDNRPSDSVLSRLRVLADGLERVRAVLGVPINISSGYRCGPLNLAIGGAENSAHVKGNAADFIAPAFGNPREIATIISKSGIKFDQLIQEGRWVHISFDERMRNETLTATFINGKANYTEGLA